MRFLFFKFLPLALMSALLLSMTSCSKGPSEEEYNHTTQKEPIKKPTPVVVKPEVVDDFKETIKIGSFKVKFMPLNAHLSGVVKADGFLDVTDKDISVEINAENFPLNTVHAQYIHMGQTCPSREDDKNGDGVIDIEEVLEVSREIIIPLDGDISTQLLDSYLFPVTDLEGMYFYKQSSPVQFMASDLRRADENIEDSIVKIGREGKINFERKVIIIYGVGDETNVPETVKSFGSFSQKASVPIACGKIMKAQDSI